MASKVKGFIETITPNQITGWCYSIDQEAPKIVHLFIGDIYIRSVKSCNPRPDIDRAGGPRFCGFHFRIAANLLALLPHDAEVKVVTDGDATSLSCLKNMKALFPGQATDQGEQLRHMLETEFHVSHWGEVKRPFSKNPILKYDMLRAYQRLRFVFEYFGIQLYLTGGNLLGVIREFDFLPHDDDIDLAFCVAADSPEDAGTKFCSLIGEIGPKLISLGYGVKIVRAGQVHVRDKLDQCTLDIFMAWLTSNGEWYRRTDFGGNIGTSSFRTRELELFGYKVLVPQYSERELEITYGPSWKKPDANFAFTRDAEIHVILERFEAACAESIGQLKQRLETLS